MKHSQRPWLLVVVAAFVALALLIPAPASFAQDGGEELTETFSAAGYAFMLPAGWAAEYDELNGEFVVANSPELLAMVDEDGGPQSGQFAMLMLTLPLEELGSMTVEEALPLIFAGQMGEVSIEPVMVGERDAFYLPVTPEAGDEEPTEGFVVAFEIDGVMFLAAGVGLPGEVAMFEPTAMAILSTVNAGDTPLEPMEMGSGGLGDLVGEAMGDDDGDDMDADDMDGDDMGMMVDLPQSFSEGGFSLGLPADWAATFEGDEGVGVVLVGNSAELLDDIGGDGEPLPGQFGLSITGLNLAELGGMSVEDAFTLILASGGMEVETLMLGEREVFVTYSTPEGMENSEGFFAAFESGDTMILAVAVAADGELEMYEDAALSVLASLEYMAP